MCEVAPCCGCVSSVPCCGCSCGGINGSVEPLFSVVMSGDDMATLSILNPDGSVCVTKTWGSAPVRDMIDWLGKQCGDYLDTHLTAIAEQSRQS